MFELLHGYKPFHGETIEQTHENIIEHSIQWSNNIYISGIAKDLINQLLIEDPKKRLGINGGKEIQKHAFFNGIDWKSIYERTTTNPSINNNEISTISMDSVISTRSTCVSPELSIPNTVRLRRRASVPTTSSRTRKSYSILDQINIESKQMKPLNTNNIILPNAPTFETIRSSSSPSTCTTFSFISDQHIEICSSSSSLCDTVTLPVTSSDTISDTISIQSLSSTPSSFSITPLLHSESLNLPEFIHDDIHETIHIDNLRPSSVNLTPSPTYGQHLSEDSDTSPDIQPILIRRKKRSPIVHSRRLSTLLSSKSKFQHLSLIPSINTELNFNISPISSPSTNSNFSSPSTDRSRSESPDPITPISTSNVFRPSKLSHSMFKSTYFDTDGDIDTVDDDSSIDTALVDSDISHQSAKLVLTKPSPRLLQRSIRAYARQSPPNRFRKMVIVKQQVKQTSNRDRVDAIQSQHKQHETITTESNIEQNTSTISSEHTNTFTESLQPSDECSPTSPFDMSSFHRLSLLDDELSEFNENLDSNTPSESENLGSNSECERSDDEFIDFHYQHLSHLMLINQQLLKNT
jgi:hypothetical protein